MHGEARDHAVQGFHRLTAGQSTATTHAGISYYAVKAMNGAATFGAGCAVANTSDPPSEDDQLLQGDVLHAPFTIIACKTGVMYCFIDQNV